MLRHFLTCECGVNVSSPVTLRKLQALLCALIRHLDRSIGRVAKLRPYQTQVLENAVAPRDEGKQTCV